MTAAICKISDLVNKVTGVFVVLFFAIVILTTASQVFLRYVLNHSFSWTEEAARFAFIWLNMLGACVCLKKGTHAVITVVVDLFPDRVKRAVQVISALLVLFAAGLMISQGAKVVAVAAGQPSPALGLPMSMVYLCVPVAGVIMAVHAAAIIAGLLFPASREGEN